MTKASADWFWKTVRSRKQKNFVYLRVAVPGQEELGKWLAVRAREMIDAVSRFGPERNLSLSLVDDREIRRINAEWREKDEHTDVLSFPLGMQEDAIGDVLISLDTAKRQAAEGGWPLKKELERLLAHGLCHCAGYTHDKPAEALRMAQEEHALLGEFGMVGDTYVQKWGSVERFLRLAKEQRTREREKERLARARRVAKRDAERAAKRAAAGPPVVKRSAKKRVSTRSEKR